MRVIRPMPLAAALVLLGQAIFIVYVVYATHRARRRHLAARAALKIVKTNLDAWKHEIDVAYSDALRGRNCDTAIARLAIYEARSKELFELAGMTPPSRTT